MTMGTLYDIDSPKVGGIRFREDIVCTVLEDINKVARCLKRNWNAPCCDHLLPHTNTCPQLQPYKHISIHSSIEYPKTGS